LHVSTSDQDEVQEIAVSATKGSWFMRNPASGVTDILPPLPYDASALEVQQALEGPLGFGSGNVEVSGGPGDAGATKPYVVTFTGTAGDQPLPLLEGRSFPNVPSYCEEFGFCPLEGGTQAEPLKFTEAVRGVNDGQTVVLMAENLGDQAAVSTTESPVVVSGVLPPGLVAFAARAFAGDEENPLPCSVAAGGVSVRCELPVGESLPAYQTIEVQIATKVQPAAAGGTVHASVSGGGAPQPALAEREVVLGEPEKFGFEAYSLVPEAAGGVVDSQAGSHPFQLTSLISLNQTVAEVPVALPKDIATSLPAGLIGDPQSVPQCTELQFSTHREGRNSENECPADSAVGVVAASYRLKGKLRNTAVPLFNLVPEQGEPARFGFAAGGVIAVVLDTAVQAGNEDRVLTLSQNTSELAGVLAARVTIWGVPGDPRHDGQRGWACTDGEQASCSAGEGAPQAFLSMPSSCSSPFVTSVSGDSWGTPEAASQQATPLQYTLPSSIDGCNLLSFAPQLAVSPEIKQASSPTGVNVKVSIPQAASQEPEGLAVATLRNARVTLPAGLQVNPASAAGRVACSEQQIGFQHLTPAGATVFSEETPAQRRGEEAQPECPAASKLGTVTIHTPLLPEPLTGSVYQAAQNENPFKSLLALYLVAQDKQAGVRVRLAGKIEVEPSGQLVSTFDQNPQLSFENLELSFFGGPRAALATTGCGSYTTSATFESWAGGEPFSPSVTPFEINEGPGGSSCSSLGGFSPSFTAGALTNTAGSFSTLETTITRKDGEQTLSTVNLTMPPGLSAMIANVTPCPEPQAANGECSAASKIGHVRASAGVGSEPVVLPEPGKPEDPVYLTGPYDNAPFGLSIVVPAEAGPFNLDENGHPVIVRAKIDVNPETGQASIESQPMPQTLQNIALQVRAIEVIINRPNFIFNATNCKAMSINGEITSAQGKSSTTENHYQTVNCATLPFKPKLTATTHARHTRRYGAYLKVKLTSSAGQANIKSVYIELPKILPSRAETLKLACTAAQFASNPANCPTTSHVGTVIAHTPVLPVPLTGSAIFVSHGGAAFPDLALVLQGDGVTIVQQGKTNIIKNITSSNFNAIPDLPINSVEVTLPTGPHSALTATSNLCTTTHKHKTHHRTLTMPTTITGQNGATTKQNTTITVQNCPKTHH
jgi:hypothetical protein